MFNFSPVRTGGAVSRSQVATTIDLKKNKKQKGATTKRNKNK